MQMFGTEEHDFITAMYGEMTLLLNKKENKFTDSFYGRNRSFSEDKSVYFSAVGFLSNNMERVRVQIYENVFAKNPLDFSKIPNCIEVTRVELE
jgi:RNA-binding protein YlmH